MKNTPTKKLNLSRETMKNLKTRTAVKAGATTRPGPQTGLSECHCD
jgi:hypothetical protein